MSKKIDKGPVPPERIEELIRAGRRRSSLTAILSIEGYSQEEIDKAFTSYQARQAQREEKPAPTQPRKEEKEEAPVAEKQEPTRKASPEVVFKPVTIPDAASWAPVPAIDAEKVLAGGRPNDVAVLKKPVGEIAATINSLGEGLTSLRRNLDEDRAVLRTLNTKIVDDLNRLEKDVNERVSAVSSSTQSGLSSLASNMTGQIKMEVVERLTRIIDSLDKSQASSQKLQSEVNSLKSFLNNIVDVQDSLLKRVEEIERQQLESRSELRELKAAMQKREVVD